MFFAVEFHCFVGQSDRMFFLAKGRKIMSILSALYVEGEERSEVASQQIAVHFARIQIQREFVLYNVREGCDAKIVYVHKAGSASYFRTWKHDDHIENCPQRFHRRHQHRAGNVCASIPR